jgi:hypothetical protein
MHRVLAFSALLAAVAGCTVVESGDVETGAMRASIQANPARDGTRTNIAASLSLGVATFVDLDGEDRFVASAGELNTELSESNVAGVVTYAGSLATATPGTEITVSLLRSADKTPAPSSTVRLPVPVAIATPAASASFSRANDDLVVTITSAASTDPVRLSWSGPCVEDGEVEVPAGQDEVTIAANTILERPAAASNGEEDAAPPAPQTCALQLKVSRSIEGTLDPAYGGGSISSTSSDSRDVTSAP